MRKYLTLGPDTGRATSITRPGRLGTARAPFFLVVLALVACAGTPPDRIAYNSIESAVDAVQTGMKAFNDVYQAGQATEDQRRQVLDAYGKFQAAARAATHGAQNVSGKDWLKLVSDAAGDVLDLIRKFKGGA